MGRRELDCIYIPMVEREVDDLRFVSLGWRIFPPFASRDANVDLLISFDRRLDADCYDWIVDLFSEFGFSSVRILEAGLSEDEAVYIRNGDYSGNRIPEFGYKNGPNKHWIWNQEYVGGRYEWSFQYEVDVIPMVSGWFDAIRSNLVDRCLISGAIYRGPTRLGPRVVNHVNGNAFYHSGHPLHKAWIEYTKKCIRILIEDGDRAPAFDVAPFSVLGRFCGDGALNYFKRLDGTFCCSEDAVRQFLMSIDYTDLIWNFSGSVEARDEYSLNFNKERAQYGSNACLVHSPMYRYWLLGEILKHEGSLSINDKEFICHYASRRLFSRDRRAKIYSKYIECNEDLEQILVESFLNPIVWRPAPLAITV